MLATVLQSLTGDPAATATLVIVAAACGATGVWVVLFAKAYLAEAFTHALLPGLVMATLAGVNLVFGALGGALAAYAAIAAGDRVPRLQASATTPVIVTTFAAGGVLLAARSDEAPSIDPLLFGNPLAGDASDAIWAIALGALLALTLTLWHGRLAALAFDRVAAPALGLRVAATEAVLLAVVVAAVAVAASLAGSLLALALLTGPALGAQALHTRLAEAMFAAAALGAACAAAGLMLSYLADWPASASIALAATAPAAIRGVSRGRRQALPATAGRR